MGNTKITDILFGRIISYALRMYPVTTGRLCVQFIRFFRFTTIHIHVGILTDVVNNIIVADTMIVNRFI